MKKVPRTHATHERGSTGIESVVFDFDGTLAELHLDFGEMKRRLASLAGLALGTDVTIPDLPALEWLEILAAAVGRVGAGAAAEFRGHACAVIVEMEMESARRGSLFPFTRPLLTRLRDKGITIAIITRNCEKAVREVFPDIDSQCSSFLAREHVPRVKPDPDHLFRALAMASASPRGAIMVGDHPLDIQTGKRAGVLTGGVWSGRATEADLVRSGADWTARDCEELMRALEADDMI